VKPYFLFLFSRIGGEISGKHPRMQFSGYFYDTMFFFSYIVQNDYQDERNLTSFSRNIHCGAKIHNLS